MAAHTGPPREHLRDLLERLHPGDEIHVDAASRQTGLDEQTCETVFEALVRVGLFKRTTAGAFLRCRMLDGLERLNV